MAGTNLSDANGLFKTVYASGIVDALPAQAIIQDRVKFVDSSKELGNYYAQMVVLTNENGVSYMGTSGAIGDLVAAMTSSSKEAQIYGTEIILRGQMSYAVLSRASSAGQKAFKKATSHKVEELNNSMRKRLEISMLYGQRGLGQLTGGISSGVLTFTDATWAPGIWAGAEGALIEVVSGLTGTVHRRSFNGTTSVTTAAAGNGCMKVTAVDLDNKQITVAADTVSVGYTSASSATIAASDHVFFFGASGVSATTASGTASYSDMAGLDAIVANASTLFNIDAASFSLWKGSTSSSTGQLSFAKIQAGLAKAANKGLKGKVVCLVPPRAYGLLNDAQSALRAYDVKYSSSKGENGFDSLMFHGVNGLCEVIAHPYLKEGDCLMFPTDSCIRPGSVDMTFNIPGRNDEFFDEVPNKNAVELKVFADQAIFCERPGWMVKLSGLTYSS